MARPQKEGVDYFPLDVYLDIKFELIEAEFGITGFGVVVKLLQSIYGGCGYYIEWTSEVAMLFAKKVGLGGSVVSEIVSASIRRGIFNRELYEKYKILTSSGIQKRYFSMVERRKEVALINDYALINIDLNLINVVFNPFNVDINLENEDINKQSKPNKTKLNNSKLNNSKLNNSKINNSKIEDSSLEKTSFEKFWIAYPNKKSRVEAVRAFEKLDPDKELFETIIKALELQKKSKAWVDNEGSFIPYPSTWLKGKRWNDEVAVSEGSDIPDYDDMFFKKMMEGE